VPLLPVKQATATITWPQGRDADGFVSGVTAPLVSGAPKALDVTIPCRAVATLPARSDHAGRTIDSALVRAVNAVGGPDRADEGFCSKKSAATNTRSRCHPLPRRWAGQ